MPCPSIEELIAYLDGSEDTNNKIMLHLASCMKCLNWCSKRLDAASEEDGEEDEIA